MKNIILTTTLLASLAAAYGQGTINFNNRVAGIVDARVYGVETPNDTVSKTGNPAAGVPAGITVYTGTQLAGTGFQAALYYETSAGGGSYAIVPGSQTGFGTVGRIATAAVVAIPGYPAGTTPRLKMVAWDNATGSSYETATIRGESPSFISQALKVTPDLPPDMVGLVSFNIYNTVPEPSVLAFGALALTGLLYRRRK